MIFDSNILAVTTDELLQGAEAVAKTIETGAKEMMDLSNLEDMLWSFGFNILTCILIYIVFSIARRIGVKFIKRIFAVNIDQIQKVTGRLTENNGDRRRKNTLEALALNIFKYAVNIVMILTMVGVFVDLTSLIAGVGVIGVVVGLAANSILNDIMSGFFIIFEDVFSVGDVINVDGTSGTVLEVGLRMTKLRVVSGETVMIPNGSVTKVTNYSVSNSVAVIDVSVAYEADLEKALSVLEAIGNELPELYPQVVELPTVLGVESLGASDIVLRMTVEVEPMQHFFIRRELNKIIKLRFDQEGIEIPFPRMVVYQQN